MEVWLIPISLITKRFLIDSFAVVPLLFFMTIFGYKMLITKNSLEIKLINRNTLIFLLTALITQTLTVLISFSKVQHAPGSPTLFNGLFGWYIIVFNMVLDYMVVRIFVNSELSQKRFIKSIYVTLFIYGLLILLPQLIATFSPILDHWVNLVGGLLEERHQGRDDFYFKGSYVTTLRRINGLCAEAAFLAAQLGIVFVPLVLASIKNHYNLYTQRDSRNNLLNWFLLIMLFFVLLFAKTSTGFLVIALSCILLFLYSNLKKKVWYLVILFSLLIVLAVTFIYDIGPVQGIMMKYLLNKQGTSNRLGGTIGLLKTFLFHPLLGVGNSYHSYYLMRLVPKSTTSNWEFINIFTKSGYPVQSEFFGFFAHYGLILMIPVILFILKKWFLAKRLYVQLSKGLKNSNINIKFYISLIDSFKFFVIMYVVLSLFSFTWNENYYLLMFFFYVVLLNSISDKLSNGRLGELNE